MLWKSVRHSKNHGVSVHATNVELNLKSAEINWSFH